MIKIRPRVVIQVVVLIKKKMAQVLGPWQGPHGTWNVMSLSCLLICSFNSLFHDGGCRSRRNTSRNSLPWVCGSHHVLCVCVCIYIWMTSKLENLCHVLFAWLHQCAMSHTAISRHKHLTSLGIEWHGVMDCRPWPHASTHLLRCWSVIGETFGHNELRS